MKLLYAEDEIAMSEAVVDVLTYHNYLVDAVYDGQDALDYARVEEYDGIILDIMMPKLNGIQVLEHLREEGNRTPVLILTAKGEVEDRISGLDAGADDYLVKPFAMEELLARVRAMLRRKEAYTPDALTFGDLSLHTGSFELKRGERTVLLPKIEFRLMESLIRNQGLYLSTEDLLVKGWGYETEADVGNVWVYISYLRKRLASLGSCVSIKARRGIGYTLESKP